MSLEGERLLTDITGEYPTEVEEMKKYENLVPPVTKEHMLEICGGDPELLSDFDEMIEYFYRYTKDVCAQEALKHERNGIENNREEILALDVARTTLHNAMIDSVRIFVRHLNERGRDTTWFPDIDKKGRVGYASLALLITFNDILRQKDQS